MTKDTTAAQQTDLGRQVIAWRSFFKVKLENGTIIAATDHDAPVGASVDNDGLVTYKAKTGLSPQAVEQQGEMNVDRDTFQGLIESDDIRLTDLRAGLYRNAEVVSFKMDPDKPGDILKMRRGKIGEIRRQGNVWMAEVEGLMARYRTKIIDLVQLECGHEFGDDDCGARIDPPYWTPGGSYTARTDHDDRTGDHVLPNLGTDEQSDLFIQLRCVQSGFSGASEPAWNTTIGGTTNDGTVVWETVRARRHTTQVAALDPSNNRVIEIDFPFDAPNSWFRLGLVHMLPDDVDPLSPNVIFLADFSVDDGKDQSSGSVGSPTNTGATITVEDGYAKATGSSDSYLEWSDADKLSPVGKPFTWEAVVRPNVSTFSGDLLTKYDSTTSQREFVFAITSTPSVQLSYSPDGVAVSTLTFTFPTDGNWNTSEDNHVDLERLSGNRFIAHLNGVRSNEVHVLEDTAGDPFAFFNSSTVLTMFDRVNTNNPLESGVWVKAARMTHNAVRYGDQDFTPPASFLNSVQSVRGNNTNQVRDVKNFVVGTDGRATITLYEPFPFTLSLGDRFDLVAGCPLTRAFCRDEVDNMKNYGGFPDVPHNDQMFFIPGPSL